MAVYERVIALKPNFAEAYNNLGNAFMSLDNVAAAVMLYKQGLAVKPDYAEAHHNLGNALLSQGELEGARHAYEKAIELEPGSSRHYRALFTMRRVVIGYQHVAALETLARDIALLATTEQIELHFALGKAYADLEQRELSFRHFLDGNALKRRELVYDEATTLSVLDRIRSVFTVDRMKARRGAGNSSTVPIFIIGMPRSGTTLIEQILASHPTVFGAGEVRDFSKAAGSVGVSNDTIPSFPETVAVYPDQKLRELGTRYLDSIRARAPEASRITDKTPSNFPLVGLIHLALPNARIIHVRRDPIDTCLSCFSMLFTNGPPYTYDIGELGRFYRAYEALMEHWRKVLPAGVMLEVRYEDVVADVERQARNIVAHCGLEWVDACLAFHKTRRFVRTASAIQVRQPIYQTSVGRWRAYGDLLQPLIKELGLAG